eukprot:CAMPEP_0174356676 /NCGR_PEP_ID=MMETSP0811_2-20130205/31263_1 /TAXON_ID=73025 ORGANISM="Eutreptiella gymnastica-like, Strain CCMP1594" /NCGR_SAMPLE_ID=MMETSP0811_2 /ASSEMBLY_ACC=CAM_ASM_000667 /LENGTH=60 /DNA_ID=CAMNT_0015488863 /DNA_START=254 /DNA_END=436 /DNA_ORIENTATION=-
MTTLRPQWSADASVLFPLTSPTIFRVKFLGQQNRDTRCAAAPATEKAQSRGQSPIPCTAR